MKIGEGYSCFRVTTSLCCVNSSSIILYFDTVSAQSKIQRKYYKACDRTCFPMKQNPKCHYPPRLCYHIIHQTYFKHITFVVSKSGQPHAHVLKQIKCSLAVLELECLSVFNPWHPVESTSLILSPFHGGNV